MRYFALVLLFGSTACAVEDTRTLKEAAVLPAERSVPTTIDPNIQRHEQLTKVAVRDTVRAMVLAAMSSDTLQGSWRMTVSGGLNACELGESLDRLSSLEHVTDQLGDTLLARYRETLKQRTVRYAQAVFSGSYVACAMSSDMGDERFDGMVAAMDAMQRSAVTPADLSLTPEKMREYLLKAAKEVVVNKKLATELPSCPNEGTFCSYGERIFRELHFTAAQVGLSHKIVDRFLRGNPAADSAATVATTRR